ncbi:hypothetical protein CKO10_04400 [Rhodospirillum rubrum]|uniref:hypothetical protein n=2 Tax=Rhodospirillum rubrum TaxID=1085 RepID=UPI0019076CF5|nr:hypothetical protein [Rhodospirillum rubrum]MBK1663741.1 hypothetical protein [Rhodospirillum rubrum]
MERTAGKRSGQASPSFARGEDGAEVEGTVLVAPHALSPGDMERVAKLLEAEGVTGMRLARVWLSHGDARRIAEGGAASIQATLLADDPVNEAPGQALTRALHEARGRGEVLKRTLLADPALLTTAEMAARLGMSGEGIRLKRKRHEVLGLDFAKRGLRYPRWQILENGHLLPALPTLFGILGHDSWAVYRFLLQSHCDLGGERALDALTGGRIEAVLETAKTVATGGFS